MNLWVHISQMHCNSQSYKHIPVLFVCERRIADVGLHCVHSHKFAIWCVRRFWLFTTLASSAPANSLQMDIVCLLCSTYWIPPPLPLPIVHLWRRCRAFEYFMREARPSHMGLAVIQNHFVAAAAIPNFRALWNSVTIHASILHASGRGRECRKRFLHWNYSSPQFGPQFRCEYVQLTAASMLHAPTSFNLLSYPTIPFHCRRIATRQFHICLTHVRVRPDLIRHRIISIDSRCLCSICFPLRPHLNWMSLSLEEAPLFCHSPEPKMKKKKYIKFILFRQTRRHKTNNKQSNMTSHAMRQETENISCLRFYWQNILMFARSSIGHTGGEECTSWLDAVPLGVCYT